MEASPSLNSVNQTNEDLTDEKGKTALMHAIESQEIEGALALVAALGYAPKYQPDFAATLIEKGDKLEANLQKGDTVLTWTVKEEHFAIAKAILQSKPSSIFFGDALLVAPADIALAVIDANFDISAVGKSALMNAILAQNQTLVHVLVAGNVDLNCEYNLDRKIPLDYARSKLPRGHETIILLEEAGKLQGCPDLIEAYESILYLLKNKKFNLNHVRTLTERVSRRFQTEIKASFYGSNESECDALFHQQILTIRTATEKNELETFITQRLAIILENNTTEIHKRLQAELASSPQALNFTDELLAAHSNRIRTLKFETVSSPQFLFEMAFLNDLAEQKLKVQNHSDLAFRKHKPKQGSDLVHCLNALLKLEWKAINVEGIFETVLESIKTAHQETIEGKPYLPILLDNAAVRTSLITFFTQYQRFKVGNALSLEVGVRALERPSESLQACFAILVKNPQDKAPAWMFPQTTHEQPERREIPALSIEAPSNAFLALFKWGTQTAGRTARTETAHAAAKLSL